MSDGKKKAHRLSSEELEWLRVPKRVPAETVIERIRIPFKSNVFDSIDLKLTPYLREPLSYVGDPDVQWIGIFAPTQSGKSVFLQGAVADAIDQDPGPLLYLFPDEKSGKKQLKEKITSMIELSPFLSAHTTGRARDISKQEINLDNMTVSVGWAGSLATMSSTPYKRCVLDEVRLMKLEVGKESNAIKFAGDRLTTYLDMGIGQGYMVSSPSVKGDLLHQQLSVPGTLVLNWHVPCPSCGEYQELDFFKHLKFHEGRVKCLCLYCGGEFKDDDKKIGLNSRGVYAPRKAKINLDGTLVEPYDKHQRMFFHWAIETPFRSFTRIYNEYLATKDKIHDYKNFWQCWLARFWIEDVSKTSSLALKKRRIDYQKGNVPKGVKLLTAGVDTQDNGFYVTVRGWGEGRRTWLIDEYFILCNVHVSTSAEVGLLFDRDVFERIYVGAGKEKWRIAFCAIDTGGHRTKEVYDAVGTMPNMLLIKGAHATQAAPYTYNKDLNLYHVKTSEYLDETELRSDTVEWFLPENVSDGYLTQFCNIRKTIERNKKNGEEKVIWKKVGQCDYRFAEVHSFICLDIPTVHGVLRYEIEKSDFKLNPCLLEEENNREVQDSHYNPRQEYDIGGFDW